MTPTQNHCKRLTITHQIPHKVKIQYLGLIDDVALHLIYSATKLWAAAWRSAADANHVTLRYKSDTLVHQKRVDYHAAFSHP